MIAMAHMPYKEASPGIRRSLLPEAVFSARHAPGPEAYFARNEFAEPIAASFA
jgi:hypothetical protein